MEDKKNSGSNIHRENVNPADDYSRSRQRFRAHAPIPWHNYASSTAVRAVEAPLKEKASVIGRVGLMLLKNGTGSWRIRAAMGTVSRALGVFCTQDIGLLTISFTCTEGSETYTQVLSNDTTTVDVYKLHRLEQFVREFEKYYENLSVSDIHNILDEIQYEAGKYNLAVLSLAAGIACSAFAFLLGGSIPIMLGTFLGAAAGNLLRMFMRSKRVSMLACTACGVFAACTVYSLFIRAFVALFAVSPANEVGYICSALFVIPGFPFITSMIDISKLDMHSGFERLLYSVQIILVATLTAWLAALIFNLEPGIFTTYELGPVAESSLRFAASFVGVFAFSMMFNSTWRMALFAGIIGAVSNTLRLSLASFTSLPLGVCTFIAAFVAGVLSSMVKIKVPIPRISMTVPSTVIMIPGLYLYSAIYSLASGNTGSAAVWFADALIIILSIGFGLIAARIVTDKRFRYYS